MPESTIEMKCALMEWANTLVVAARFTCTREEVNLSKTHVLVRTLLGADGGWALSEGEGKGASPIEQEQVAALHDLEERRAMEGDNNWPRGSTSRSGGGLAVRRMSWSKICLVLLENRLWLKDKARGGSGRARMSVHATRHQ